MYIKIKVVTDAKQEKIEKIEEDSWRIWVTFPAENNAANRRILEILHNSFEDKAIRIVSGHHSPSKIVSIV
ncbi:MAG: DUF167 domain-containing protein [Candidatus Pacebacteria bacterium]|nr:DUF167 domain-containing protein [Candidatus Paceibacterota bacterium]MBP9866542.1 DUF167 domain-containing protein [Candidatus Paceibacterota bacterium]